MDNTKFSPFSDINFVKKRLNDLHCFERMKLGFSLKEHQLREYENKVLWKTQNKYRRKLSN